MFIVNRIQFLLCATLLIHWTSASPSSRFNARLAQSGRGTMTGDGSSWFAQSGNELPGHAKGQIISECPYEIIVSPIRPTKKIPRFLP